MGASLKEHSDGLWIQGGQPLSGATVESFGDHRIAMAFAVAALGSGGAVHIKDADAVAVSDPRFLTVLEALRTENS